VHVPYNTFSCADGFIVIAVITDNFWQNLKEVLPCAEFDDPTLDGQPGRLAARDMINDRLNEMLKQNTCEYWLTQLEERSIPCAPVNKFSQALADPQVQHRNMVIDLQHPDGASTRGPGNPIKLSRSSEESFSPAPLLGQHTQKVFSELLGCSDDEIQGLRDRGVVG
jgi:CoA:oxalate CoA-transferase